MTPKRTVVRLLMNVYPRSWRDSYGPEVEAILLSRPLTAAATFDVLRNALVQRIRRTHPCRTCGVSLFALSFAGLIWNWIVPLAPDPYIRFMAAVNLALLAAASFATASGRDGIGRTAIETMNALLIAVSPSVFVMLLWTAGLLDPAAPATIPRPGTGPHSMVFYLHPWGALATNRPALLLGELFSLAMSGLVIGLIGGILGRLTRAAVSRATRARTAR